ncbi:sulfite dehydrogenase [Polaromonas sp. SM01]|uniref:sulfite dehydrogenase n=1 Tax=Polaromonas sp. SM01 TaxID=3085630 RepID=UPI0029825B49|nr:sulfite dehydrogenase [Polaromonas sp. SM01]MDW5441760.1 sulfite dehydrogenase [Polaromonas sp. SM01]
MLSRFIRRAPENFLSQDDIKSVRSGRRGFLAGAVAAAAASSLAAQRAMAQDDPAIVNLPAHSKGLGQGVATRGYGMPSEWEKNLQRRQSPGLTRVPQSSVSFAPLQGLFGIITPSGLHFERHHQGWWDIDPTQHRLMVNGSDDTMLKRPMVFSMDELMRLPSVSRMHFIECGANTGMEWGNAAVPTVQYTHGMLSCSEFTGVPLRTILELCGADFKRAKFVLGEGADGSGMTRTIPMSMVMNGEVLVAYGQNGEMLRPENGYPLRLIVPGVQGVSWIKYLRRIELGDMPYATKDETIHYVDLMPNGLHRQYTSIQEVKSVITSPSGGQVLLEKGFHNVTGLAWSGRGKIKRVEVSVDGGKNWKAARLEGPVLSKCLTRFNSDFVWDGKPAFFQSRAIDETGQIQPTYGELRKVRASRSIYHNNAIQSWALTENGEVNNVQLS